MSRQEGRTPAQWVTVAAAVAVLLVVVAVLVGQMLGSSRPAQPEVAVGQTQRVGSTFQVPVTVRNEGDDTAANVQVSASLVIKGETVAEGDQSIDFLAGGEETEVVFVLPEDPADGALTVHVTGYAEP
ncbi:CARDB domain-containing protein [Kribbia dieselivorans]|uniref:CARDB domain-containing protein n=1 Tax=Kribbia dieselivorans TaxID=331526 RepID=UPI000838C883|nr:CARDB domain-containing protein [Kribbia dieselivorans]